MLQSQNGNAQSASVVSIKYTVAVKLGLTIGDEMPLVDINKFHSVIKYGTNWE